MQLSTGKALNLSAAGCPQGHEWGRAQPGVPGCPLSRSTRPVAWGPVRSSQSWQITVISSALPASGISRCRLWRSMCIVLMGQKGLQRDWGEVWRCDLRGGSGAVPERARREPGDAEPVRSGSCQIWARSSRMAQDPDCGSVRATVASPSLSSPCPSTWVWIWNPKQWNHRRIELEVDLVQSVSSGYRRRHHGLGRG